MTLQTKLFRVSPLITPVDSPVINGRPVFGFAGQQWLFRSQETADAFLKEHAPAGYVEPVCVYGPGDTTNSRAAAEGQG